MESDWRKRILIIMLAGVALVGARTAYVFHERSKPFDLSSRQPKSIALTADDYVHPRRIVPYDLKTARKELAGKTIWVRTGNAVPYYRFNETNHSVNFAGKVGLLPPLERLEVKDVILARPPVHLSPGQVAVVRHQVMAIFGKQGSSGLFAVSIGSAVGDDFTFTVNELLFFDDPHELYKHWPFNVWSAIEAHRAEKGMNELQVSFALGNMVSASAGDYGNRSAQYHDGDDLVTVTFANNRATEIVPVGQ